VTTAIAVRTTVITGASTGIGRATALHLAGRGWQVFAGVRRERDAESLRSESMPLLRPLMIDVIDGASVKRAAAEVRSHSTLAAEDHAAARTYGDHSPWALNEACVAQEQRSRKPQLSGIAHAPESVTSLLPRTRDFPGPKRPVECHRESRDPGRNPAEARDVVRVSGYAQARFRRPLLYPSWTPWYPRASCPRLDVRNTTAKCGLRHPQPSGERRALVLRGHSSSGPGDATDRGVPHFTAGGTATRRPAPIPRPLS
jgi:hypothetical protein